MEDAPIRMPLVGVNALVVASALSTELVWVLAGWAGAAGAAGVAGVSGVAGVAAGAVREFVPQLEPEWVAANAGLLMRVMAPTEITAAAARVIVARRLLGVRVSGCILGLLLTRARGPDCSPGKAG
jgi:hypothetical protein